MWTRLPCQNFHLLVCCAILDSEKQKIMDRKYGFNEILKVNLDYNYYIHFILQCESKLFFCEWESFAATCKCLGKTKLSKLWNCVFSLQTNVFITIP